VSSKYPGLIGLRLNLYYCQSNFEQTIKKESMSIKDRLNNTTGVQRLYLASLAFVEICAFFNAYGDSEYAAEGLGPLGFLMVFIGKLTLYTFYTIFAFAIIFVVYKVIRWIVDGFKKK
jgi:hypothetical protein